MSMVKSVILFLLLGSVSIMDGVAQQAPPESAPSQSVLSSDDISDEELLSFVEASDAIRPIQLQVQEDIQGAIEDHGFTMERFQEVIMVFQNPEMDVEEFLTGDEEEALDRMEPVLMELEMNARDSMIDEISYKGLEVERYQQIFMTLQQDPDLMERVQMLSQ
ncbi:MAG: DUF4168 domain-containing protein [Balneolaceae bacterium]